VLGLQPKILLWSGWLLNNSNGASTLVKEIVQDYTDTLQDLRKAVVNEDRSNEAIRAGIYHVDAIIFIKDWRGQYGKYVAVSRRWEQFFGRTFNIVKGLSDYELMHPHDADKRCMMEKTALETGRTQVFDIPANPRMLRHDKVTLRISPFRVKSDDCNHIVGVCLVDYLDV
jgi:PAS domain-containing protein